MGITKFETINAQGASAKIGSVLPTAPYLYYDVASNDVDSVEWHGGELYYNTGDNRLYIQQNTSGTTAEWKRLLETFATSTTSTSTSTSSSSSSSSSTSSSSTTTA